VAGLTASDRSPPPRRCWWRRWLLALPRLRRERRLACRSGPCAVDSRRRVRRPGADGRSLLVTYTATRLTGLTGHAVDALNQGRGDRPEGPADTPTRSTARTRLSRAQSQGIRVHAWAPPGKGHATKQQAVRGNREVPASPRSTQTGHGFDSCLGHQQDHRSSLEGEACQPRRLGPWGPVWTRRHHWAHRWGPRVKARHPAEDGA
jgi:hypothetical protein